MKFIITLNILILVAILPTFGQTARVQSDKFSLEITPLELYDPSELPEHTSSEDTPLYIELGETLEGATIKVVDSKLSQIKIEMRFETSITIMNEGPHCDLINWKHFTSDWVELESAGQNTFKAGSYSKQEREKFPDVSIEELKEAVENQCSGWGELVKAIKSPNEYPSGVEISRYFLRITGKDSSGKKVSKIITFMVPMGC